MPITSQWLSDKGCPRCNISSYMTQKSSAGSIVDDSDATPLLRIKCDPVMLSEFVDKPLQKISIGYLAGAVAVYMGNCAGAMSVR